MRRHRHGGRSSETAVEVDVERTRARGRRVVWLAAGVLVLGLGDLQLTYTHASSVGMHEVNPVGAYLIAERSWWGLTLFKIGTLGVTLGLLLKVREHAKAEAAAWMLAVVMMLLTLHWHRYTGHVAADAIERSAPTWTTVPAQTAAPVDAPGPVR